jgi:hypothetical protein
MGESEHKREQNKRTRDAQEAKNVSRCTEENRCRATSSMGKGKSCEKIQLRSHRNEMPENQQTKALGLEPEAEDICGRMARLIPRSRQHR